MGKLEFADENLYFCMNCHIMFSVICFSEKYVISSVMGNLHYRVDKGPEENQEQ